MTEDILRVFEKAPGALPLYEAGEAMILQAFPDAKRRVTKTQVGFFNRYGFAWLWPPLRKIKGRPGLYIVLTFGLGRREAHPRIVEAVEPYPGRFTHHVLISSPEELDAQVLAWLQEAYAFALHKGRAKRDSGHQ